MPSSRSPRPTANPVISGPATSGDPRWRVGTIALLLLGFAGYLSWQGIYAPKDEDQTAQWLAAAIRVGLVMAAIWLAWPDLRKLSPWMLGLAKVLLPITAIVIVKWPRYMPVILIGVIALCVLRPRGNRRS